MLFVQFPQLVFQLFAGVEPELGNPDIGISRFEQTASNAGNGDDFADNRHLKGFHALAGNGDRHFGARFAAHHVGRFFRSQFTQRFVVDLDDQITCLNASPVCRRIINGADHLDVAVLPTHLDAQPTEFA